MAVPTTYTENQFAEYIHSALGAVASSLGWTVAGESYEEIINDALILFGVESISSVSGMASIGRLRQLGQLAAWRQVVKETSGDHDFSADGGSYSRSQVNEMARGIVRDLEASTAAYRDECTVSTQRIVYVHNPYSERDPNTGRPL